MIGAKLVKKTKCNIWLKSVNTSLLFLPCYTIHERNPLLSKYMFWTLWPIILGARYILEFRFKLYFLILER